MNKIVVDRDTMHWYGEPPCIPCGQQLFSQFEFSLSEDWDNANILAQFKQGDTLLNVAVTENTCYVPYELNPGTAYLRLRGTFERNSEVIATVNELQFNLVQGFEPGGSPSVPPTPDLYQKLIQSIQHTEFRVSELAEQAQSSAKVAKANAERVAELASQVAKNAAQAAQDATESVQAKEAAQTAQHLAETAQQAAEAAKRSAEAAKVAVAQSATDAEAAKQGAETAMQAAQDAAESAAQALENIQELYQQMQTWAQGVIQDVHAAGSQSVQSVQDAGDAQVKRVAEEGTTQTANAKAQADAAAQSAQEAADSAAVYDNIVADVTQLKKDIADITPDDTTVDGKPWTSKKIVDSLCQPIEESGNPVQVYPVEGYPLGVKVSWEPVQEGEGDPSPDNIRPITGRDSVSVTRCGKNLLDLSNAYVHGYNITGIKNFLRPNTRYIFRPINSGGIPFAVFITNHLESGKADKQKRLTGYIQESKAESYITPEDMTDYPYLILAGNGSGISNYFPAVEFQIELGSTATPYEPYTGSTTDIALPETVYGGTLDVETGVVTVDRVKFTINDVNKIVSFYPKKCAWAFDSPIKSSGDYRKFDGVCNRFARVSTGYVVNHFFAQFPTSSVNYVRLVFTLDGITNVDDAKAYFSENTTEVVYKIAEPYTIQLTPQQITALSGVNTLYTDADGVIATGAEDPKHTITELKNAIISLGGNV